MIGAALLRPWLLPVVLAGAVAATALTDEDVVRMIVAGTPEDEIVRTIETSAVRFDLSEEMLVELRLARVPERVIGAMRARQARSAPPTAPRAPVLPQATEAALVPVSFFPARDTEAALWIPVTVGEATAKALQLGSAPEKRRVDGVAVFVACTTPSHVPDQWRSRSPLGRDFVSMPRHEMLELHASAVRVPEKDVPKGVRASLDKQGPVPGGEWLRLALPVELSVSLLPGEAHDLVAGVAILVGETYLAIARDERRGVVTETLAGPLRASLGRHDAQPAGVEVRFVASAP